MRTWLRRIGLFALGLLPVAVSIPAPALSSTATQENFDRLRDGMTEDEVLAILGPSGEYHSGHYIVVYHGISFRAHWAGDEGAITIEFGPSGHEVEGLTWLKVDPNSPRRVAHKSFRPIPRESYGEWWLRYLKSL